MNHLKNVFLCFVFLCFHKERKHALNVRFLTYGIKISAISYCQYRKLCLLEQIGKNGIEKRKCNEVRFWKPLNIPIPKKLKWIPELNPENGMCMNKSAIHNQPFFSSKIEIFTNISFNSE